MYQSDITQFLNQLKQQKPNLEDEQRRGRALLWDKQPIDLDERASNQAARVQQTSLGIEFFAGGLQGVLASDAASAPITDLWAGTSCVAR